jgi:lysozyme
MHMTAKKMPDRGLLALARFEAITPGPYLDVKTSKRQNVWTFGIGHTAAAGSPDQDSMSRRMSVKRMEDQLP